MMGFDKKEYMREYRQKNKERDKEALKRWRNENYERYLENQKAYRKTPMGRADILIKNYKKKDKKYGRGNGDLTPTWVVENILFKPCAHCGKTGWKIIGCNRLDNSKPHTKDNVEPCCKECNDKLAKPPRQIDQIDIITGEIIHRWSSITECIENGFQSVKRYCEHKNIRKETYKGYKWLYVPL